jgi:Ca2+/Na+ antiporter
MTLMSTMELHLWFFFLVLSFLKVNMKLDRDIYKSDQFYHLYLYYLVYIFCHFALVYKKGNSKEDQSLRILRICHHNLYVNLSLHLLLRIFRNYNKVFIHRTNDMDLPNFNFRPFNFCLNLFLIFLTVLLFVQELISKVPNCNNMDYNMDIDFLPSLEQMD